MDGHKIVTQAFGIKYACANEGPLNAAATERRRRAVDVHVRDSSVLRLYERERTAPSDLAVNLGQVEDGIGAEGGHLGQVAEEREGFAAVFETGDGVVDEGCHAGVRGGGADNLCVETEGVLDGFWTDVHVEVQGEVVQRASVDVQEAVNAVAAHGEHLQSTWVCIGTEQDRGGQVGVQMEVFEVADVNVGDGALHAQPQGAVDLLAQEGSGKGSHAATDHRMKTDALLREELNADLDLAREMNHVGFFDMMDGIEGEGRSRLNNGLGGCCSRLAVVLCADAVGD